MHNRELPESLWAVYDMLSVIDGLPACSSRLGVSLVSRAAHSPSLVLGSTCHHVTTTGLGHLSGIHR